MNVKRKKIIYIFILIIGIVHICITAPQSYALAMIKGKAVDYVGNIDIRHGDFIFQHLAGPLTELIVNVDGGIYSHCGIIIKEKGRFYVLEAIGPVKRTPINDWISRGIKDQFTVVRLKEDYQKGIFNIVREAKGFMGRPYDIQYEWDDKKVYCSELIYKAVLKGAKISLAEFEHLGDMNWQPYESEIRRLDGGELPLDRMMITPDAVALSDKVQTIFSNFPIAVKQGAVYDRKDLLGSWQGNYTVLNLVLSLDAVVAENGMIERGILKSGLFLDHIGIKNFNKETGEFFYEVKADNDVKIQIAGRIGHGQDAIYGQWSDSLGFDGMFHMSKK